MFPSDINFQEDQARSADTIPQSVAIFETVGDIQVKPFKISFEYYNDKECEIKELLKHAGKEVVRKFRLIGKAQNTSDLKGLGIDMDQVNAVGDYKKLFRRLPEDVELKEDRIQGTARIFYFTVEKDFYIVAIKANHLETKKIRR